MTVDELMEKVEQRQSQDPAWTPEKETTLDATCWFVACKEGEDIRDAWAAKDYARAIRDGDKLGGPYKEVAHLEAWIEDHEEAACLCPVRWRGHGEPERDETRTEATCPVHGMIKSAWDWLDAALDSHFGIARKG